MTKAFDSALRLLNRREHSAYELYNKLEQKGFSSVEIEEALEKCKSMDLQSDLRFTENFSRLRIRQGYGPVKISQELKQKGIDAELIEKGLHQEHDNWLAHAIEVWQKKCKGHSDLSFVALQKQQRFLLYRGFSRDIIARVVKELKQ